jgi:DNA-binding SARP family transcriptional activator
MGEAWEHVKLLGRFELRLGGQETQLPVGAQRLIALLALRGVVRRQVLAGILWPEKNEVRAAANLRSSLWRVGQASRQLVECTDSCLRLAPSVGVDLPEMTARARRLLDREQLRGEADLDAGPFLWDLLPDWYDDWVLLERERVRQVRMHALEALCQRLTAMGRFSEAIDAGLAAVAAEPLRESAHLALMRAYDAEGNRCEVMREYRQLCVLLRDELGVAPSPRVEGFVRQEH